MENMQAKPLILQKKAEVLLNREIYPMLKNFPRAEKFALCQEIKQSCYRVIRNAIESNCPRKNKLKYYDDIDIELKYLLVLIAVARDQKYISKGKALQLQEMITELGKICGGLIKSDLNKRR